MKKLISARRTPVLFASLAAAAFAALPAMAETASSPTSAPTPPAASTPVANNSAAQSVSTQILSADQQQAIGLLVKSYIAAHPEIVQDALDALDKRQKDAEADKARTTIKDNNATIFNSAHQVVLGNPQGNVTMVEFFEYNCAYCKRALPDMMGLLSANPNLRFVLKEFPVLGDGSVEAAHVAVAARMQDPTGKKYIEFHQKLLGGRGQADKARALAVAKEVGMDMARLEKDMGGEEVRVSLEESLKLAETLGLNGTPSYVVGNDVVVGAVGLDALRGKISTARCGKESC
ncbi:MAG: DsbA family protein [Xanthobacteraceae bacterium]